MAKCRRKGCRKATKRGRPFCSAPCYRDSIRNVSICVDCGGPRGRMSKLRCARCHQEMHARAKPPTAPSEAHESLTVTGDTAQVERVTTQRVKTLADLIRVCEIDVTIWNVVEWQCKASQSMNVPRAVRPTPDEKWTRPSTEPVLTQMFHVSAKLRRKTVEENTLAALRVALLEDIRAELKAQPPPKITKPAAPGDWLFEFSPFDLHMGKYTWDEETVANYDVEIAEDLFNQSLDFLLAKALKFADGKLSRVLCVFGNDVSHMDSKRGETTQGTRMDVDTRYIRVYRRICAIHRRAVDILREIAPVDVKIVPGNHDELTSFHLGEVLATRYDGDKRVTVDNSPRLRKYYDWGINLFGFTHGDAEKVAELPLVMAREQPELWSRCTSREWHIGHRHIKERFAAKARFEQEFFSDKGVRVRRLMSLSAHDAWHTKHAYMDRRTCEAFLFHKRAGYTSELSFNVDHKSGRPLSK